MHIQRGHALRPPCPAKSLLAGLPGRMRTARVQNSAFQVTQASTQTPCPRLMTPMPLATGSGELLRHQAEEAP